MRQLAHREAEAKALKILVDGLGEGLVLEGEGGYYALYYFHSWYGRKAPDPDETPDWVEGPKASPEEFLDPYDQALWLEDNGYTLFINESK